LDWVRSDELPDDFDKLRKQAEKLSELLSKTEQTQSAMRLMLTHARYRQEHHLVGSQALARDVLKCLQQEIQTDTPAKAIAYTIMVAEAQDLSGLPGKAAQTLEDCLQVYFPEVLKHSALVRRELPPAARAMLMQLSDLYLRQAETSLDVNDKRKWYGLAAGCLIRIASSESGRQNSSDGTVDKALLLKISTCQDALALMGIKLNVPTFLRDQLGESNVGLVQQLIRNRKYHAALELIGRSEPSQSLELFRLTCQLELGRVEESLICAQTLAKEYGNALEVKEAILSAADQLESMKHVEQATQLYMLFADTAKDHAKAPDALLKRATYCRTHKQLEEAAKLFKRVADAYPQRVELTAKCYFSAAQCYQQVQQFMQAKDCAVKAEAKADTELRRLAGFLAAYSALQYALQENTGSDAKQIEATWAKDHFAVVLADNTIPLLMRRQASQGAQIAAETAGNVTDAVHYLDAYLKCKGVQPTQSDTQTARRLMGMAAQQKNVKCILQLSDVSLKQSVPENIPLAIGAMDALIKLNAQSDVFIICKQLQALESIPDTHLLRVITMLDSQDFDNHRKQADQMQLSLVTPRLDIVSEATREILLYQLSVTASRLADYDQALALLDRHLGKDYTYKYLESKMLRASVLVHLNRREDARKDYKEVMLASREQALTIQTSALLAQTHVDDKQWQQALSSACFCLPLLQNPNLPSDQLESLRQCLEIVCDAYLQLGQQEPFRKYVEQYINVFPDGAKVEQYQKALERLSMNTQGEKP
jgi:tetratricopeptide (TPR) repeat protein